MFVLFVVVVCCFFYVFFFCFGLLYYQLYFVQYLFTFVLNLKLIL